MSCDPAGILVSKNPSAANSLKAKSRLATIVYLQSQGHVVMETTRGAT